MKTIVPPMEALNRLREGNRRFVAGAAARDLGQEHRRCRELAGGQSPFAIVLGCSDSRVPAELIFDQGLGDLFVIRVAGNIVAPSLVGSVEYAADRFGVRLVVVLGHSQCGAVIASLEERDRPSENRSPNLQSIVDRILPSLQSIRLQPGEDPSELWLRAVRENIRASVRQIRYGSQILERLIRDEGLQVVGAEYALETGVVEFFDGLIEE
jgi:carbonic anhydrase